MKINEAVLCELCLLSYSDLTELQGGLIDEFDDIQLFQMGGAECTVVVKDTTAIVVVRGSETTWLDWLHNFQFLWPAPVHRGFQRCADRLDKAGLWRYLEYVSPKNVFFAGHSLGGATAGVLAWEAICRGYSIRCHLFSVGSPRVGVEEWTNRLYETIVATGGTVNRLAKPMDLVTQLPPPGVYWLPRYRHIGGTAIITSSNNVIPDATLTEGLMALLWQVVWSPYKVYRSHSISMYLPSLLNWVAFRKNNHLDCLIEHDTADSS